MVSTYLNYRIYSENPVKSLFGASSDPVVSRDSAYYRENIGSVKSIDEFFDNYRLYSYAMKAYGLEEMTYAKAFMRKVLESDLSDSDSFVNKLSDTRYRDFAEAFSFGTDGTVTNTAASQSDIQEENTVELYTKKNTAASETAYYTTYSGGVSSVDDLFKSKNEKTLSYIITAYGFDPDYVSEEALRSALTSDLSDPASYANTMGGKMLTLAQAFNFDTDGTIKDGYTFQSEEQRAATVSAYSEETGYISEITEATDYYSANIVNITSVDDLLANEELYDYALTALGLDPEYMSEDAIRQTLTSDLSDPASYANTKGGKLLTLAQAFNFDTSGAVKDGNAVQSAEQLETISDAYIEVKDTTTSSDLFTNTLYYQNSASKVETADEFLADAKLEAFIRSAYGLDEESVTDAALKKALTSDLSDPASYVNRYGTESLRALAKDFNFDASGAVTTTLAVQSSSSVTATVDLYTDATDATTDSQKAALEKATTYYEDTIGTVTSLDGLLADDKLVDFILKAYGLEGEHLTTRQLKQIFTSDLTDKRSFVNQQTDTRFRKLAEAFNFDTEGLVIREAPQTAQSRSSVQATYDAYLQQTIEIEAGVDSEGVRLALYFERKASSITSAYSVLADDALLKVVQTALGFPAEMGNADIDIQAALIAKKINFDDFQDTEKVKSFIARFSALYDAENDTSASNSAVMILNGSNTIGVGQEILTNIQTAKYGG